MLRASARQLAASRGVTCSASSARAAVATRARGFLAEAGRGRTRRRVLAALPRALDERARICRRSPPPDMNHVRLPIKRPRCHERRRSADRRRHRARRPTIEWGRHARALGDPRPCTARRGGQNRHEHRRLPEWRAELFTDARYRSQTVLLWAPACRTLPRRYDPSPLRPAETTAARAVLARPIGGAGRPCIAS